MRVNTQDTTVQEILSKSVNYFKVNGIFNSFLKTYTTDSGHEFKQAILNGSKLYYISKDGENLIELHVLGKNIDYKLNNTEGFKEFFNMVEVNEPKKSTGQKFR